MPWPPPPPEMTVYRVFFFFKGAKNHGVIMPDANKENTINQVCGVF